MDAIVKVISTVDSRYKTLPVTDGNLIFVRDTHTVAMDYNGSRTEYHDITTLTDQERQSTLAPVVGFYYCTDTNILWRYQEEWVQVTTPPAVIEAETSLLFPLTGRIGCIYVDTTNNASYRWDNTDLKYYCIGRDYNEIQIIDGCVV